MPNHDIILLRRVLWLTALFILGLVISGITAIPLRSEVRWLRAWVDPQPRSEPPSVMVEWLVKVQHGLNFVGTDFPFLFYGTDWLAFGHFVIAIAFIGALRDPVRNRWLFDFGLIACVLVIPYVLVFGGVRGIPLWWRMIDCSFGIIGAAPLLLCRKWTKEIELNLEPAKNV